MHFRISVNGHATNFETKFRCEVFRKSATSYHYEIKIEGVVTKRKKKKKTFHERLLIFKYHGLIAAS